MRINSNKYIYILVKLMAVLFPFMSVAKNDEAQFTVVIDAGHGGKDFGACDNGAREKEINLGVARHLESLLKKKMKEAKVVMTRSGDKYLTLQERADIANKAKGDLFISIHTNSVDKSNRNRKTVSGSSVYALGLHKDDNNMKVARRENSVIELENDYEQKYSGFDPSKDESYIIFEMAQKKNLSKSIRFAENVQKELVGIGRKDRGVHQAGFWVLWATSMPSVLVELDFICNPGAADYMNSDKGRKEFAKAIFKAVEKYHDTWKRSRVGKNVAYENTEGLQIHADEGMSASETGPVMLAAAPSAAKKVKSASLSSQGRGYAMAKRRRRSESSRVASERRSFETDAIPLHSESERGGTVLSLGEDSQSGETVSGDDEVKKEDKKKNKKKEKKKKDKKKKGKKKRDKDSHNAKTDKFVKVYKIQILASADLLKQNNPRFCGLAPISTYKENNLYKYFYGESPDRAEIDELLKDVKKKIPDAFVITSVKSVGSAKN